MPRIIKADQTRWVDGQWVVEPVVEELVVPDAVETQIAELLAQAQEQANHLLRQAQQDANQLLVQAQQEGFQQGHELGLEQGTQEGLMAWAAALEHLGAVTQEFIDQREELLSSHEPDLVRLAMLIAGKILGREVRDAVVVRTLVRSAMNHLEGQAVIRVRLNPADVGRLSNPLAAGPRYEIVSDAAVGLGGCIVETQTGRVDASFATQFEELARMLLHEDPSKDPALRGTLNQLQKGGHQPPPRGAGFGR